jgi:hypothetical protein
MAAPVSVGLRTHTSQTQKGAAKLTSDSPGLDFRVTSEGLLKPPSYPAQCQAPFKKIDETSQSSLTASGHISCPDATLSRENNEDRNVRNRTAEKLPMARAWALGAVAFESGMDRML